MFNFKSRTLTRIYILEYHHMIKIKISIIYIIEMDHIRGAFLIIFIVMEIVLI